MPKFKDMLVAFGSRVRGKARKDSDYDVLIILNNDYDWKYRRRITPVIYDLELKYDIFIDKKIISKNQLEHSIEGLHPLYRDAINEGIHA